MTINDPEPGAAPKKRRLPFKRTVERRVFTDNAATTSPKKDGEEDNDLDFFRRSKDVFPLVVEEVEKAAKEDRRIVSPIKRRRPSLSSDDETHRVKRSPPRKEAPIKREVKKAAVLSDSSDNDLIIDVKGKGKEIYRSNKTPTPRKPRDTKQAVLVDEDSEISVPSTRQTRQNTRSAAALLSSPQAPINISDSSDDDVKIETKPKLEVDDDDDLELEETEPVDDEFSMWAAKARELEAENKDAIITILVTSRLENSKALMVRRKAGQRLGVVLDTWIAHQRSSLVVDQDMEKNLFLTWKGNKVYSSSTAAALGIQVDANGNLIASGDGYEKGGLHLEAWTEDEYAEYLKAKERERAERLGIYDADFEAETRREPTPEPARRKGIKLVLKAKNLEPLKLVAHDDTTVKALIRSFKKQQKLAENLGVSIHLDGEMLDEDTLIKDADIDADETNQLEVHIK